MNYNPYIYTEYKSDLCRQEEHDDCDETQCECECHIIKDERSYSDIVRDGMTE